MNLALLNIFHLHISYLTQFHFIGMAKHNQGIYAEAPF
jgi:hypothetical protein